MLCSILIASRKRFEQLLDCVNSVIEGGGIADYEIIVRLHHSDLDSLIHEHHLDNLGVKVIKGDDLNGYESLSIFYSELIESAQGYWCWHLNDDMTVFGSWYDRLSELPQNNSLVQPETHRLNTSFYHRDKAGPAPIHPRTEITLAQLEKYGSATDICVYEELHLKRQFPIVYLKDVGVWHHWGGVESHIV